MIGPNMATMLAFVLTDAAVAPDDLAALARAGGRRSRSTASASRGTPAPTTRCCSSPTAPGRRSTGDDLHALRARPPSRSAPSWPARSPPTPRGPTTWSRIDVEGTAHRRRGPQDRQGGRRQRPGQDRHLRRRSELGPHRLRRRLRRRRRSRRRDLSLWLGDLLLYDKGTPLPFDAAAASAYMKNNRELTHAAACSRSAPAAARSTRAT